jgi:hypothetical protein
MSLPKIIYTPVSTPITLQFVRGPQQFGCYYSLRAHDNLSTGGLRERVVEASDMLIAFSMLALRMGDDMDDWASFMAHALAGGQFDFYPNAALASSYCHCVSDDTEFQPARNAPGQYAASFKWRIVPDSQAPANPGVVMGWFYGIS